MFNLQPSKCGKPTLVYNNNFLHSRYDPEKEAERFINESLKNEHPSLVLLLGAGLGYLSDRLKNTLPDSKHIFIFYSEEIFKICNNKQILHWHPGMKISINNFLVKYITEIDLEGLKIIEWSASSLLFPEISKKVNSEINSLVKEFRGNIVTTNAFGKTWIRNSFSNFISINRVIKKPCIYTDNPVVIAASGPTLEIAAQYLKKEREKINLWSLPSAIPFLLGNNLNPDLIVLTDSSFYSICHIKNTCNNKIPIIMPLSSVRGVYNMFKHIYLISQPFFYESILLDKTGMSILQIPPKGTVASTAMELALKLTNKEVIFCGLDLCFSDIKSHVRTSFFNSFLMHDTDRLSPYYSRSYSRAVSQAPLRKKRIRTSTALETYANWFSEPGKNDNNRLFRFIPSENNIKVMTNLDNFSFRKIIKKYPVIKSKINPEFDEKYPDKDKRKKIALDIIKNWKTKIKEKETNVKNDIGIIFKDSDFLELAYFIDLTDITLLKKSLRYKKNDINEIINSLFDKLNSFTDSLYNKISRINY